MLQHDQFGDGSMMVWGEVHAGKDEILRNTPRPYTGLISPGFLLMHDKAQL